MMEIRKKQAVLMAASVASMIDQFNMPNLHLLKEMGYEVHVACNFKEGNTCDKQRIQKLYVTLHMLHIVCHQWDCPRSLVPVSKIVRAYWQMVRLLEKNTFAWMHCQSPIGGALARAAAHTKRVRVVYTAHGFHCYRGAPATNWLLYYPVEKLLAHWTNILVTVNREDEHFARRYLRAGEICRIPGVGIDAVRFQGQEDTPLDRKAFCREYALPEHALILLSVGELSKRKNHHAVLQAVAGIDREDVYYMICGQGELRDSLKKQARQLGIAEHVRIVGYVEDVQRLYAHAHIFVFPSLQEGLPVALMEAMAAGLACVASDIRGNRELISSKGGGLVPLGETKKLQEKLQKLLEQPELRKKCGCFNQKKIKEFSLDIVQNQMQGIYNRMRRGCFVQVQPAQTQSFYKGALDSRQCKEVVPEVSVIMAVYCAADGKALKEAVHSICIQSFTDWELLICDDGSKDHTWAILQQLAAADARIRLLRLSKNHKAGYARNQCIRAARGRYLAVMDADDLSAPDRLEKQVEFLKTHPQFAFVGSRGEFFIRKIGDDGEGYPFCQYPQAADFLFSLPYVHASLLFCREALEQVEGYDSHRYAIRVEDYDLLLRLYGIGLQGANLDEVLYYIRRDRKQYQRRRYRYRFHEAYIRYQGFRRLKLMPKGILYTIKPLIVGLLPTSLLKRMQQQFYAVNTKSSKSIEDTT